MTATPVVYVIDKNGTRGTIESTAKPSYRHAQVRVTLDSGEQVFVPVAALQRRNEHEYYLPHAFADLPQHGSASGEPSNEPFTIPVAEETLTVHKRAVQRKMRVKKTVHERKETIDEPVVKEEIRIERVAVNRMVDGPVAMRQEGDTLVIPVLEEVVVSEKRLLLREEVRITKRRTEESRPQQVTLRREEVSIEPGDGPREPKDKER